VFSIVNIINQKRSGNECRKRKKKQNNPGAWVAQLAEHPTLDFGWGGDLRILRLSPVSGSTLSVESAWDSLSPSPSAPPPACACSLSLNK